MTCTTQETNRQDMNQQDGRHDDSDRLRQGSCLQRNTMTAGGETPTRRVELLMPSLQKTPPDHPTPETLHNPQRTVQRSRRNEQPGHISPRLLVSGPSLPPAAYLQ